MCSLRRLVTGIALATLGLGSVPARAADAGISFYFSNTYIWRGINFNDSGVMQMSLDAGSLNIGGAPLSFNVWGNMDVGDFDGALGKGDWSEVDLTATLELPKGFSVGYIEYLFPGGAIGTRELFVGWSRDFLVTPSATFYYDVDEVEDFYATIGLGYSYALTEKASLDFGGLVGIAGEKFAEVYTGGTEGGLYNFDLNAGVSVQANDIVGVSAVIGVGDSLNSKALPDELTQGFYFGAAVSFAVP